MKISYEVKMDLHVFLEDKIGTGRSVSSLTYEFADKNHLEHSQVLNAYNNDHIFKDLKGKFKKKFVLTVDNGQLYYLLEQYMKNDDIFHVADKVRLSIDDCRKTWDKITSFVPSEELNKNIIQTIDKILNKDKCDLHTAIKAASCSLEIRYGYCFYIFQTHSDQFNIDLHPNRLWTNEEISSLTNQIIENFKLNNILPEETCKQIENNQSKIKNNILKNRSAMILLRKWKEIEHKYSHYFGDEIAATIESDNLEVTRLKRNIQRLEKQVADYETMNLHELQEKYDRLLRDSTITERENREFKEDNDNMRNLLSTIRKKDEELGGQISYLIGNDLLK